MSLNDTDAAARWAKAAKTAEGITDDGVAEAMRPYFTAYLPAGMALMAVVVILLEFLLSGGAGDEWAVASSFGFTLGALGVFIGGMLYGHKRLRPRVRPQRENVLIWLTGAERRRVRRQIFGRTSVVPQELSVTRAAAAQIRAALGQQLIVAPGYLLLFASQFLSPAEPWIGVLRYAVTGLFAVAYVMLVWEFRRAGAFLARTEQAWAARQDDAMQDPEENHDDAPQ